MSNSDNRFTVRTTTKRGCEIIADALRRHNPEAARAYLEGYWLRREIEKAAQEALTSSYRDSLN